MPFNRPTIQEIIERTETDLVSRLQGRRPQLRFAMVKILARVIAGVAHGLYGFIAWASKQLIPDTADIEFLERWASLWGLTRNPASYATGEAEATGTEGNVIPTGTRWQSTSGIEYEQLADATIVDGVTTLSLKATVAGEDGNAEEGDELSIVEIIPGITAVAVVTPIGISGGVEQETPDALLLRLSERLREKPQGGSKADYIAWARSVPGVTRVWPYPQELGAGTVTVRFMMDDTYADGIPQAADVTAVQAAIDDPAARPVTATVTVAAPVATELDFTIKLNPNDVTVQAAVTAELKDLLRSEGEPGGTILLSHIKEAISRATGETDNQVVLPAGNVVYATGQIPVLGTITWQSL